MDVKIEFSDKLGSFSFEGASEDLRPIWMDVYRIREEERYRKMERRLGRRIQALARDIRDLARMLQFKKSVKNGKDDGA